MTHRQQVFLIGTINIHNEVIRLALQSRNIMSPELRAEALKDDPGIHYSVYRQPFLQENF